MSQKPVFIVVTAGNCGFCTRFKSEVWPTLKPKLVNSGRLSIVEIELETMGEVKSKSFAERYPVDLRRYTTWFPTFILCTAASWENGDVIDGVVLNGEFIYDHETQTEIIGSVSNEQLKEPNDSNITQWLSDNLRSNKFMNSEKSQPKIILTDRRKTQGQKPQLGHKYQSSKKMKYKIQTI